MPNSKMWIRLQRGLVLACAFIGFLSVGNIVDAVEIGKTTHEIRGGNEQNGHTGLVQLSVGCTGSMIGPTLILTSAHCFSGTTLLSSIGVKYYAPGLDASKPDDLGSLSVKIQKHPSYNADAFFHEKANHDIALVELLGELSWPTTDYHDYLRIYQDFRTRLPDTLDLYGTSYNTSSGSGFGILRMARFEIERGFDYRLELDVTKTKGACAGDSGGPYLIRGHDLLACVHSHSERPENEECVIDKFYYDFDQYCARTVRRNVGDLINDKTNVSCVALNNGTYQYTRCFDIPFIEDIAYEGLDKEDAVAMTVASIF